MKMMGRPADFCGTKEKREENETMISMWKKANAFFFPGSFLLYPLLLSSRFSQKTTMASQPQPRHENHRKGGLLLWYERKERKE
jgi:hypothetical protein